MSTKPLLQDLGRLVVRSSLWMLVNSAIGRGLSLTAQIVLAALLSQSEFGVYAAAMSISALLTNFRGGGMYQWLIQGGRDEFDNRAGHAFWTGVASNVFLGALVAALAVPAGEFFGHEDVVAVLLVSAIAFPLISFGSYYKTSLAIMLRMREVSAIEVTSAVVKYSLIITLAFNGWGALSFVLPLPVAFLLEGAMGYAFTRDHAWRRRSNPSHWLRLIRENRWILAGTFVATIALQIDYVLVGKLAPIGVLGVYYFAYQMTYMSAALITENARRVLFPGLVAVPIERRAEATLRASSVATLLGAPALMVLGAVIEPLESLLWDGKWGEAVLPIQILSLGLPLHLMTMVTQSSLQSSGNFRLWSGVNAIRAFFVSVGALVAGLFFATDAAWIAAIIGGSLAAANLLQIVVAYRTAGVRMRRVLVSSLSPVLVAPVALLLSVAVLNAHRSPDVLALLEGVVLFFGLWLVGTLAVAHRSLVAALGTLRDALRPSRSPQR